MSTNEMTGAEIFVKCLMEENVEYIFGYPGGAVIGVYDAMHDMSDIKHILTRHEQGAVHAAEGYAKATGKVGVVIVTSGPGATNTVTGIADAHMDSVPLVVFTGQVATNLIGNDAFQEADIIGITRSITKHNFLVKDVRDLAWTIKAAFYIASTGRPGPVVVDMPKDVMASATSFSYPKEIKLRGYRPFYFGHMGQINKAVEIINSSKKPVLYVGGGVINSNASKEVYNLAKKLNAPVAMTLMGLGSMPGDDRLSLGMLGMHGTWYSNTAVDQCDCLIAIGARFDDRVTGNPQTFSPNSRKVHIDIDPSQISKNVKVDVPIVGDVRHVLERLTPLVHSLETTDWLEQIDRWKNEHPLRYESGPEIRAQYIIEKIYELTDGEAVVTADVGQNQMWAAQFYKFKNPRSFLTSGGLGTMGFSFPASIGAAFGVTDRPVFSINGDGGIQMNIQELTTAVGNKLPIKIIVLDNGYLGMVRQWQDLFYKKRYSHVSLGSNPDFAKIAEAFGAKGFVADKTEEVVPILKEALKINDRPVMIDFKTTNEDNVFPMIPSGRAVAQMIDYPKSVEELKMSNSRVEAAK
ncbi:MAG: biosynthetic-type acetolactate synthase large subunit [Bacteroidetes bacterium]|nr:biosynthetic-type acetolactate synthase large subunit [Bacteroidota bacterium]